jgi:hypothetical protein
MPGRLPSHAAVTAGQRPRPGTSIALVRQVDQLRLGYRAGREADGRGHPVAEYHGGHLGLQRLRGALDGALHGGCLVVEHGDHGEQLDELLDVQGGGLTLIAPVGPASRCHARSVLRLALR